WAPQQFRTSSKLSLFLSGAKGASRPRHLYCRRARTACQGFGFIQTHAHLANAGMRRKKKSRRFLGGNLQKPVLSEPQQRCDFIRDGRIVHAVTDLTATPGRG